MFLLGYPGVGKRTVGSHLSDLLDGVLVDNSLLSIPLLTLFKWDGKFPITMQIWERVGLVREAVLGTIEDLAPKSNSYVFTNVLKDDEDGARQYDRVRRLAQCRGSLFLSVMLDCDVDEQVRRIDTPDRVARLKGSDPEGYRRHRYSTEVPRLCVGPAQFGGLAPGPGLPGVHVGHAPAQQGRADHKCWPCSGD